jgi:hypothetical protein
LNEPSAHERRSEKTSGRRLFERSTEPGRIVGAVPASRLQVALAAAFDVLDRARAELDGDAYTSYIAILTDRVGHEAARLAVAEAIRITRRNAA